MLTHSYSSGFRFLRHLGLPLLRLTLRGLFCLNRHALWTVLRLSLVGVLLWPARRWRAWRGGLPVPATLQVVDDVRCGARCTHCLFSAFDRKDERLSLADLDRLFAQAAALGVGHVYLMGADPFHRPDPGALLDLLATHRGLVFYLFTEGQRLDQALLDRLRRAGNIVPMLNIDGLEAATERRKGPGSWARVSDLLDRLRAGRVPWFVTTMVSTENFAEVTGEAYVEALAARGAWVLAYLPYTPVDARAEAALVLSPAQRAELYRRSLALNSWRRKLVVLDLLGIEQELTRCPAGREAITVYHDGTLAPCAALPLGHRASNVREKPLGELFQQDPLYRALRDRTDPRCLFFEDTRFLADYLDVHEADMAVLNPEAARQVRERAR